MQNSKIFFLYSLKYLCSACTDTYPLFLQAMSQLPGFSDMIDDPEKWRESMMQVRVEVVVILFLFAFY